jgi:uncharacterized protein YigA (DUF484 family)
MSMKADNVAEYLQKNPDFFNEHADILTDLLIPHPYGGRTISLSERQMLMLRERVKELEKKLYDWMEIAKENEALQNKVHRYTLAILGVQDSAAQQEIATSKICEVFSIPHAVIRLWREQPPSAEVMAFADEHAKPVCAHQAVHDMQSWFGDSAAHLRSFAYLPLRNDTQSIGMLILASEDAQRFYPEMGTIFLQRIAEIVSRAVQPD